MNKYFCFKNIHIFLTLLWKHWEIQIGTVNKSYNIVLSYKKVPWHNGPMTITVMETYLVNLPGYGDPTDITNWGYNEWDFYPIGFRKKYPISSEKLILNELLGENNWNHISLNRNLTLDQLEEFRDKVDWKIISSKYKMSYKFIKRNKDKIILDKLAENRKISQGLKNRILREMLSGKF